VRRGGVLLLLLCFEAGLATGLSRFLDPVVLAGGLLLFGLAFRFGRHTWLAVAAGLGLGLGTITRARSQAACAALLPAGVIRLVIALQEPVQEGIARATVSARCPGSIGVRIRADQVLPAGSRWAVTGRWIPMIRFGGRPDGLLVVGERERLPGHAGPGARWRNWLADTIERLYGRRAGLVAALLTGGRGDLDPVLKAAFARSGLVHLLAISGLHVGILYGWAVLLLKGIGVSRHRRAALATLVAFGYVAFLGWPPPATRAALLVGLGTWSAWRQRHPSPMSRLAVTVLLVTMLDPWALFELGAWLSAAACFGTIAFTRWSDRALGRGAGWRMLFASLGATLATAPFTAAVLGNVALAGIGLNFLAIPLAGLAVPAVLLSVLTAPLVPPLAGSLAAGGGLGLAGLEGLAVTGSAIPLGAWVTGPGVGSALPWIGLLGLALWAMGRRNTGRRAALRLAWAAGLVGIAGLLPVVRRTSAYEGDGLALHFLSVGQGDAALIRTPGARWILVDAGPAGGRHDAGREVVVPFLVRHGVRRLAAVIVSHAHLDHVGGVPAVLDAVPADLILEPAEPVAEPHYLRVLELAAERGMRWRAARAGDSLVVDGVVLRILHPDTSWGRWREDLNDDSVVLLVRHGHFEALLAGDLGVKAESLLAGRVGPVDLLKVGHHGSATSTGESWLAELRPRAAIVSVGPNRYGHPAPGTLARLAGHRVDLWRTDREGSVAVTVRDSSLMLRGRARTGRYSLVP
jgi:competence protein ComEC